MNYRTDEYRDARKARYKEAHKDDIISEHGQKMRDFFEHTTRESRAENRAKRQAIKDIIEYLIETHQIDPRYISESTRWMFE